MKDHQFTEEQRRRLLRLAIDSVPAKEPPDDELLDMISKLSGTDTIIIARRWSKD